MITAEVRIRVAPSVHAREFDGELILVDLQQGQYFGLNEVGMHAWSQLLSGSSPAEIAASLVADYDVDERTLTADLVRLVDDLVRRGLVEVV